MAAAQKLNVRRSLERLLFPALEARGFVRHRPAEHHNLFPFGEFLRQGTRGLDQLEIQFDKNLPSRFRVNLAVMPADYRPNALRPPTVDGLHYYLMRRGLMLRGWFGARRDATQEEYDAVANEIIALLPEVDAVFRSGRYSRRMWRMPQRAFGIGRWKFPWMTWALYGFLAAIVGWLVFRIASAA